MKLADNNQEPLHIAWFYSGGQRSRSHFGSSMWWQSHPSLLMLGVKVSLLVYGLLSVFCVSWLYTKEQRF